MAWYLPQMASPIQANGMKRVRPGRRLSLRQVVDLQSFSFEAAKGLSADFQSTSDREERARVASAISNLGKAWVSLQDAKREILGKPKAGVFKPERKKPKHKTYEEMMASYDPSDAPSESQREAYEPTHETVDMPGFPGAKISVPIGSPVTPAVAEAKSTLEPVRPAPPPDDGLTPLGRAALAQQRAAQNRPSSPQIVRIPPVGKRDVWHVV
jgi:hypothetical protein